MSDGREVIAKGRQLEMVKSCQPLMEEIAKGLGVPVDRLRFGPSVEGFGSVGVPLMVKDDRGGEMPLKSFLRIPFLDDHDKKAGVVAREMVDAGYPLVQRMLAVRGDNGDTQVIEVPLRREERVCLCGLPECECYPLEATILVQVLEQLVEGEPFSYRVWRGEVGDDIALKVYQRAGENLRNIHDGRVALTEIQLDLWRQAAVNHVIDQSERMGKIVTDLASGKGKGWFIRVMGENLMKKMRRVAANQIAEGVEMVRAHGDYWMGNWWLTSDGQVVAFDWALAFAPRGYDLGFGMGNELIRYLANLDLGNGDEKERGKTRVEGFMRGYGDGWQLEAAKAEVWNPLAFKMLVGAAYDPYPIDVKKKLVVYTDRLLRYKIDNPDAVFDLDLAVEIWEGIGGDLEAELSSVALVLTDE